MFSKFLLKNPFVTTLRRSISWFIILILFTFLFLQVVFIEFLILFNLLRSGAIIEGIGAIINNLDIRIFQVLMVDRLVGIEEHQGGLIALQEVALGEIEDASTVDKYKESDLLVDLRLFDPCKELSVSGDRIDLILDVLALE